MAMHDAEAVTRAYDDRINAHDLEGVLDLCADDITMIWPIDVFEGKAEVGGIFQELFTAFPDYRQETGRIIAAGDHVACEFRGSGSFTGGSFTGFEPTGKHVTVHMAKLLTVRDGRLIEIRAYYDQMEFARDAGLLPDADSAGDKAMAGMMNAVARVRRRLDR